MQRRSFLSGILAAAAAPAIVKTNSLMPIWTPKWHTGGVANPVVWWPGASHRNESWDTFVLMQIQAVAENLGVPLDDILRQSPVTRVQYSSARESLLRHQFHTPLSRPLNVRSNHGQFPS